MAKGITYKFTDMLGNEHTRYSKDHHVPNYTHAIVRYNNEQDVPRKNDVSFHGNKDRAVKELTREQARGWHAVGMYALDSYAGRQ